MCLCDLSLLNLNGLLLFIFAVLLIAYFLSKKDPHNFPPGPLALPLLGNVFSIEARQPHIYLTKVGGQKVVFSCKCCGTCSEILKIL